MISGCLELLGLGVGVGGTLLVMVACGLPTWKVSAYVEGNIVVAQSIWDGLWMSCVVQSTGQMQCKLHDSVLALGSDLQTARALTVCSAVVGVLALAVTVAGARCTNCMKDDALKAKVVAAGGVLYGASGLLALVPLCWMSSNIISDFYNQHVSPASKREIGAALYIGFAGAALLVLGGGTLFCCARFGQSKSAYPVKRAPVAMIGAGGGGGGGSMHHGDYDKRNYV